MEAGSMTMDPNSLTAARGISGTYYPPAQFTIIPHDAPGAATSARSVQKMVGSSFSSAAPLSSAVPQALVSSTYVGGSTTAKAAGTSLSTSTQVKSSAQRQISATTMRGKPTTPSLILSSHPTSSGVVPNTFSTSYTPRGFTGISGTGAPQSITTSGITTAASQNLFVGGHGTTTGASAGYGGSSAYARRVSGVAYPGANLHEATMTTAANSAAFSQQQSQGQLSQRYIGARPSVVNSIPTHTGTFGLSTPVNASAMSNINSSRITTNTAGVCSTNRTVTGQQHTVATNTYVDESRVHVVSERVTEHEVRVPKKVVREEIIEKVIVVPEKCLREEMTEEVIKVRQKIVEVAKPTIQETIVEVPEIEYIENIVEVPEIIVQEKIKEVPRLEIQERIVEVPRIVKQERRVEVPEIEYVEVPYEKVVEVPEVHEQVVVKQVPVPQYIEKPYPEYVTVEVHEDVARNVPIPVEAISTLEIRLPQIRPRYSRVDMPLYAPRFIEVAIPAEMLDEQALLHVEQYAKQLIFLASQQAASLCEVEKLGGALKNMDFNSMIAGGGFRTTAEMSRAFDLWWQAKRFQNVSVSHLASSAGGVTTTVARTMTIPHCPSVIHFPHTAEHAFPEQQACVIARNAEDEASAVYDVSYSAAVSGEYTEKAAAQEMQCENEAELNRSSSDEMAGAEGEPTYFESGRSRKDCGMDVGAGGESSAEAAERRASDEASLEAQSDKQRRDDGDDGVASLGGGSSLEATQNFEEGSVMRQDSVVKQECLTSHGSATLGQKSGSMEPMK